MNVLIVEDEQLAVERLEKLIRDYDPSINVLYTVDTVKEAAAFMSSHQDSLDLVFMDIQLADGKSFEIFGKINYSKPVIFTTAYDEYALRAFKLNSVDYLLKPIKYEELDAAINKYKELSRNPAPQPVVDSKLLQSILQKGEKTFKQRFVVKFGSRIQFKNSNEVAYFYAEDKICYLMSASERKRYVIDHTLEELDDKLLDPSLFFRINRQYIICVEAIKEVKAKDQRLEVLLSVPCEDNLKVSRGRTSDFKDWLNK
ncbi:MAG: LytTR family DNA-binding domain-containing protein [Bacteroidota bacterium]